MRIIAGSAGRNTIKVPAAVTRPSTDFVRQAMFSILTPRIEGARVLDLFAGSGALGLEALSRGAASCVFVDHHRVACNVIQENLVKTRLTGGHVIKSDALGFLKRDTARYDLIFADPPYCHHPGDTDWIGDLLAGGALVPHLADDGCLVCEITARQASPQATGLDLSTRREYGSSALLFYTPPIPCSAATDPDEPTPDLT